MMDRSEEYATLCEQMNQISEALFGYREGQFPQMLLVIAALKLKAENVEIENQFRDVMNIVEELNIAIQEIKQEA